MAVPVEAYRRWRVIITARYPEVVETKDKEASV